MFRTISPPVPVRRLAAPVIACLFLVPGGTAQADPFEPVAGMELRIKGSNALAALDSSDKVVALLDDVGAPSAGTLRARIQQLRNTPFISRLQGLGGIQARAAAETTDVTLVPMGNSGAGNYGGPLTTFDVTGQIQEEVDLGGGATEAGFYYEPGQPMHIWVEMITTATRTPTVGNTIEKRWAEMFRVEIPANAVVVEYKSGTGNNVFPGFGQAAFPINSTTATGFNWKLWAVGEAIRVTNYWVDPVVPQNQDPSYVDGQKHTPDDVPLPLANVFATDPNACLDMMFATNPAEFQNGHLPPDAEPPFYCLGRCKNPPILNTR